jgi:acyl-CoA thioester hydrolase
MGLPDGFKTFVGVHRLRVRFADTDQMRVAYHGAYIPWIEEGRTEWMREQGRSYRSMEDEGLSLAVTSVEIQYLTSALYDDLIEIETRLEKLGKASILLAYRLYRVGERGVRGPLLARAKTKLALLGPNGRPLRVEKEFFSSNS